METRRRKKEEKKERGEGVKARSMAPAQNAHSDFLSDRTLPPRGEFVTSAVLSVRGEKPQCTSISTHFS